MSKQVSSGQNLLPKNSCESIDASFATRLNSLSDNSPHLSLLCSNPRNWHRCGSFATTMKSSCRLAALTGSHLSSIMLKWGFRLWMWSVCLRISSCRFSRLCVDCLLSLVSSEPISSKWSRSLTTSCSEQTVDYGALLTFNCSFNSSLLSSEASDIITTRLIGFCDFTFFLAAFCCWIFKSLSFSAKRISQAFLRF